MSAPEIRVTQGYAEEAFYPMCPAANAIARAFETRTFSRRALAALQDVGVTVIIDGQPQSYLASEDDDCGLEPIGDVLARLSGAVMMPGDRCEIEMPWAAERKINSRCSHDATTIVGDQKLCTFHANRAAEAGQ